MSDTEPKSDVTALTVQLLSAYLSNNNVASENLADLIRTTKAALTGNTTPESVEVAPEVHTPAVSVRKSLASPDHIISLIDGKPYKMLKRHLATHGLTPKTYRERYNLPSDYPTVASGYAADRRAIAERVGLGGRRIAKAAAPDPVAAPAAPEIAAAAPVAAESKARKKPGPKASAKTDKAPKATPEPVAAPAAEEIAAAAPVAVEPKARKKPGPKASTTAAKASKSLKPTKVTKATAKTATAKADPATSSVPSETSGDTAAPKRRGRPPKAAAPAAPAGDKPARAPKLKLALGKKPAAESSAPEATE